MSSPNHGAVRQYLGERVVSMNSSPDQIIAYQQGYEAEKRIDIKNKDVLCPYPIGYKITGLRQHWFNGLYDNRFSKYDHIPISTDNAIPTDSKTKGKDMGKRRK